LKKIYNTPSHEGSFSEPYKLRAILKKTYNKNPSIDSIKEWLAMQRSYTYHKRVNYKFPTNPVVAGKIDGQWESDLMFLPDLAKANNGFKIALVVVDVVSRYAWVEPMKTKHGDATTEAMMCILKRSSPRVPESLHTDAGKEFFNHHFKKLMTSNNIVHFLTATDSRQKAALAERFNRTLKEKIYKFLDSKGSTGRYIDILQDLVHSYNNTVHSAHQMKPADVNHATEGLALWNLYKPYWTDEKDLERAGAQQKRKNRRQLPALNFVYRGVTDNLLNKKQNKVNALKPGDLVRLAGNKHPFFKEYKGNWTEELFKISRKLDRHPHVVYEVCEYDDEPVSGIFHREELQRVRKPVGGEWEIEKTLKIERTKNGKERHFVKWLGYADRYNSWVTKGSIIDH
jgi:transposase InsO family protein